MRQRSCQTDLRVARVPRGTRAMPVNEKPRVSRGVGFLDGGDGGIRTHVPRKANAFRVRPVMTTSIRLHIFSRSLTIP